MFENASIEAKRCDYFKDLKMSELVEVLKRDNIYNGYDLARELGVCRKTITRYIKELRKAGYIVYSARGPHGCFTLDRSVFERWEKCTKI